MLPSILPLPLTHSWPLFERGLHLDLGRVIDCGATAGPDVMFDEDSLVESGVGLWSCDLASNRLAWSAEVYDLFGLPRGSGASRAATVALYAERSRATMERLRAHAIRHQRGFTLDAEIMPVGGERRWIRLVAAPVCENGRVVALHGSKLDVTANYIR